MDSRAPFCRTFHHERYAPNQSLVKLDHGRSQRLPGL